MEVTIKDTTPLVIQLTILSSHQRLVAPNLQVWVQILLIKKKKRFYFFKKLCVFVCVHYVCVYMPCECNAHREQKRVSDSPKLDLIGICEPSHVVTKLRGSVRFVSALSPVSSTLHCWAISVAPDDALNKQKCLRVASFLSIVGIYGCLSRYPTCKVCIFSHCNWTPEETVCALAGKAPRCSAVNYLLQVIQLQFKVWLAHS